MIASALALSMMAVSCKNDKAKQEDIKDAVMLMDSDSLKMESIDFLGEPIEGDTATYTTVAEGTVSTLEFAGIEGVKAKWQIDGEDKGESETLEHTWTGTGIQEIKAIFSEGTEKKAYVKIMPVTTSSAPEPGPSPTPAPDPVPLPDRDGDNVPDYRDQCPDEPGTRKNFGCPNLVIDEPVSDDTNPATIDPAPPLPPPSDADGDGVPDNIDKCPNLKGTAEFSGCLPPPPPPKDFKSTATATTYRLTSMAALEDEKETTQSGTLKFRPAVDLILFEAKLKASRDGNIEFTLEGDDIKGEITIKKAVNPGISTVRFNDLKHYVLRAGKNYTLSFRGDDDVKLTWIKNAYAQETFKSELNISGKTTLFDVTFKY